MNCKMIVCTLPHQGQRVLLVKYRGMPDRQAGWFVPHDLLNEGEHPEAAAKRVLADQFGIADASMKFSHFESFTGNDKSWHLIFHFTSARPDERIPKQTEDLAAVQWFDRGNLPPTEEIAHHGWAADIVKSSLNKSE